MNIICTEHLSLTHVHCACRKSQYIDIVKRTYVSVMFCIFRVRSQILISLFFDRAITRI